MPKIQITSIVTNRIFNSAAKYNKQAIDEVVITGMHPSEIFMVRLTSKKYPNNDNKGIKNMFCIPID
jgi:hypothetical protein